MKAVEIDEDGNRWEIPIPDDWVLDREALGWEYWVHSPDKQRGVLETGKTQSEALKKLRDRMEYWLGISSKRFDADK